MHSPDCNKLPLRLIVTALLAATMLLACRATPEKPVPPSPPAVPAAAPAQPAAQPETPPVVQATPPLPGAHLRRGAWTDLPGWRDDDPVAAWSALLASCGTLRAQDAWRQVCTAALALQRPDREQARRFFETQFTPYQLLQPDGAAEGLATGYYEPLLRGSRTPTAR